MIEKSCSNCIHYRQHYILDDQSCTPIDCGHCVYPRLKHRRPNHPACAYYEFRRVPQEMPDRKSVVHFLTTQLLQYILSLDLPPEQK